MEEKSKMSTKLSAVQKTKSSPERELNSSSKRTKQDDNDDDDSNSESKSQVIKPSSLVHYQDTTFNGKKDIYCSFSSSKEKSSEPILLNPVQQLIKQVSTDLNSDDEDEQKTKLAAAKKLLFPGALATSFNEVADTLRNERRQEFCPIYKDETPEEVALRQTKRKPIGSLLEKRIRWDDLKRKREEEERKAQMSYHYGPYGPVNDSQSSFANPYEQYYSTMQNQYDMMVKVNHAQQEYSGFWPEYQQQTYPNNDQITQSSAHYQAPPYTYPYQYSYPSMNSNTILEMNTSSWTSADYYNLQLLGRMQPPPPPPPDEP